MQRKPRLLILTALAVGAIAGVTVGQARADGESDTHRIALALDKQTAALERIARSVERMADQHR